MNFYVKLFHFNCFLRPLYVNIINFTCITTFTIVSCRNKISNTAEWKKDPLKPGSRKHHSNFYWVAAFPRGLKYYEDFV